MKNKIEQIVGKVESGHLEPKEAVDELLVLFGVVGRSERLSRDLDRGDFVEYKGGSNSRYLTRGKKYRLTGNMWSDRIPIEADNGKRMTTLQRYFRGI